MVLSSGLIIDPAPSRVGRSGLPLDAFDYPFRDALLKELTKTFRANDQTAVDTLNFSANLARHAACMPDRVYVKFPNMSFMKGPIYRLICAMAPNGFKANEGSVLESLQRYVSHVIGRPVTITNFFGSGIPVPGTNRIVVAVYSVIPDTNT